MSPARAKDRRARLQRVEEKIAGLIEFIATGERSDYIAKTLRDYETQAKQESAAIKALVAHGTKPIELPSPDVVLVHALDLKRIVETDPVRGQEELKKLFEGGKLFVKPQPEGHYVAESRIFPFALLALDLDINSPDKAKARGLSAARPVELRVYLAREFPQVLSDALAHSNRARCRSKIHELPKRCVLAGFSACKRRTRTV